MSEHVDDYNQNPARTIPWPGEWHMHRAGKLTAQAVVLALIGVAGVTFGIVDLAQTPTQDRGIVTIILAPLFLGMSALLASRVRIRSRRPDSLRLEWVKPAESPGVVIPYSRSVWVSFCVMTFAMLFFYGLIAIAGWVLVAADGASGGILILPLLASGATLYMLWFIIDGFREKLTRGAVALTPSGVYHRSWAFTSFFAWDKTLGVEAEDVRQLPAVRVGYREHRNRKQHMTRHSRVWKQPEWKQAPDLVIIGTYLSVDPVLLYHALQYYFEHPEQRTELGTEAGVERLCRADVVNR